MRSAGVSSAVSHIGCSSRGGPGSTSTVGLPGHDQPRRRAHRLEHGRPLGHQRLLAVAGADRVLVEVAPAAAQPLEDRPDPLLQRRVERERAPGEVRDDLGGQVVGGRAEAAAGHDEVEALGGHEVERGAHVGAAVGHDQDLRDLDAALAQALGQPRPVAVGDDPRQHLGAGDEDARSHCLTAGRPPRRGQLARALAGAHLVADRRRAIRDVDRAARRRASAPGRCRR